MRPNHLLRKLAIASVLTLAGCASVDKKENMRVFEDSLKALVNLSESDLIQKKGIPTSFYEAKDNIRYLTYAYTNVYFSPAVSNMGMHRYYGNWPYSRFDNNGGYYSAKSCVIVFKVEMDRVTGWSHSGDACSDTKLIPLGTNTKPF